MAEGWARKMHGDWMEVHSAGSVPHGVDARAVKVMAEAGVDISDHTSNHVDQYLNVPFDLVVTVCDRARESCPVFPGRGRRVHHTFDDPPFLARDAACEEEALTPYRRVRDEIRDYVARITDLL
jgi:arsenate reductase